MDKYTPNNIDDCMNHWCYKNHHTGAIKSFRNAHNIFFLTYCTILIPCFVFVTLLVIVLKSNYCHDQQWTPCTDIRQK